MDFMSIDVSDERAPKGLTCPTITAVPDDGPAVERCPLCDNPRTLAIIQEKQAEGQEVSTNSTGLSAVKPRENSVDEKTTDLADGPAGKEKNDSEDNEIRRRAKKPKITPTEEPASGLARGSEDWPIQTQSQTPAPSSADKRLAGIRGHRRTDGISITNSGDYRSSRSIDMFSNSQHYLD